MTNPITYRALTYGTAVQNSDGTWTPPEVYTESTGDWGTLRVEVGATWDCRGTAVIASGHPAKTAAGTDITTISGVPTLVESLSYAEPYGETTASFSVPRLTPWDDPAAVGIVAGANIDVWRVLPTALAAAVGTAEVPFWHGIVASLEFADGAGIATGLSVQATGALYGEASVRAHQPFLLDQSQDIGTWAGRALTPQVYERPLPPFERFTFTSDTCGIKVRYRGSRGQSVIDYCDELLALAKDATDGTWTISRSFHTIGTGANAISVPYARAYSFREKDIDFTGTVQTNSISVGGYGLAYSLSTDATETVTAIYGEGIHPVDATSLSGSRWRNAVYPMLTGTAPAYPDRIGTASDYPVQTGDTDADFTADVITQLQSQLRVGGWPDTNITGTFDADTVTGLNALYESAGTTQSSVVAGTADWTLIFGTGNGFTDLGSGFFLPLYDANPFYTYAADGDVIGTATGYDPTRLRVDETISYGEGIKKSRARRNAKRVVNTTGSVTIGSITLTSDVINETVSPRSRMDIREGGWIRLVGLAADDYYIAGITISPESEGLPVTLTVSTKADDLLALSTKIDRNRAAKSDPARSFYNQRSKTVRPFRSAVGWDAESGAGVFTGTRSFAAAGSAWTVHRILGSQYGSIASLRVTTDPDVAYCFAVFGGSVSAAALGSAIANPLGTVTGDYPSWWQHPDNTDFLDSVGFIEAWGDYDEHAGYYPGAYSIGTAVAAGSVTGVLEDAGSWTFASLDPPWLWVAAWPRTSGTATFSGKMRIVVDE